MVLKRWQRISLGVECSKLKNVKLIFNLASFLPGSHPGALWISLQNRTFGRFLLLEWGASLGAINMWLQKSGIPNLFFFQPYPSTHTFVCILAYVHMQLCGIFLFSHFYCNQHQSPLTGLNGEFCQYTVEAQCVAGWEYARETWKWEGTVCVYLCDW